MYKEIFFCVFLSGSQAKRRIVGGRDVHLSEFPYVASWGIHHLEKDAFYHVCTCSILSPTWTISAAHCEDTLKFFKSTIRHSSYLPTNPGKYAAVLQTISHPTYTIFEDQANFQLKYDICVVQSERIILEKYCTLSAVDYTTLLGHQVIILGHGITNKSSELNDTMSLDKPLQVMDGLVSRCLEKDLNLPMAFCLMPKCGEVALITGGDSGGPVIHASGLVGINSASSVAADTKRTFKKLNKHSFSLSAAGIISAVSPCLDWISQVTIYEP